MITHTGKSKVAQEASPAGPRAAKREAIGGSPGVSSVLHLQRTAGESTVVWGAAGVQGPGGTADAGGSCRPAPGSRIPASFSRN